MKDMRFTMLAEYHKKNDVTLVTGDCRRVLHALPTGSAQLVVTSPPYNVGKSYEQRISVADYKSLLASVIKECVRIVRPGGSICFQVGNFMTSPNRPKPLALILDSLFTPYEETDQVYLRNMVIWHFGHGLHARRRFSGRYETILWYTKGDDYVFNLDDVRVPQKYPGKRHFKGKLKGKPSGNPRGKNPGDVWTDLPNVKANHVEKTKHPCQFPVGLAKRLILALSKPEDLIVDPFLGAGSTAAAAVLTGRRVFGCDLRSDYVQIARQRARRARAGTLSIRGDHPVREPDGREAVARVPEGWHNFLRPAQVVPGE